MTTRAEWVREQNMLREARAFRALPAKLRSGIRLLESRLKNGIRWRWDELEDGE